MQVAVDQDCQTQMDIRLPNGSVCLMLHGASQEVQRSGKAADKLREWILVAEACQQQEADVPLDVQPDEASAGQDAALLSSQPVLAQH